MMKILITGNMGYIGPVLVRHLRTALPETRLSGFDAGYFAHCLTGADALPESRVDVQYFGDIRDIGPDVLDGVDAVVHLAAVSNDPMGNRYEEVTHDINYESSIRLARMAVSAGVQRFVFASSCSMYGWAEGGPRRETDPVNPLTAYARSKVATEKALADLDAPHTVITALRFSTACGMSDRLRLDLVLNDFVASAIASGTISVLSDGTPWRPLIDVKDMARAIEWALIRDPGQGGPYVAVNVGADAWNYRVRDLATAVAAAIPGTRVQINENAPPDRRSYRVDFARYRELAPGHQPAVTLEQSIEELKRGLERMRFRDSEFRASHFMRLKVLETHVSEHRLTEALRWVRP